jgi:uncharacterized membrane protein
LVYRAGKLNSYQSSTHTEYGNNNKDSIIFIALAVLLPYFLFTSGFVFEITHQEVTDKADTPYSVALSSYRLDIGNVFDYRDGAGADWLTKNYDDQKIIYSDSHSAMILKNQPRLFEKILTFFQDGYFQKMPGNSYAFLRTWNTERGKAIIGIGTGLRKSFNLAEDRRFGEVFQTLHAIYNNSGAQILVSK